MVHIPANITSPTNITIIDNGSDDEIVVKLLEILREKKFNIVYKARPEDFEQKGKIIEDLIKKNYAPGCISIPLDCDEFLTLDTSDKLECRAEKIKEYLLNLIQGEYLK